MSVCLCCLIEQLLNIKQLCALFSAFIIYTYCVPVQIKQSMQNHADQQIAELSVLLRLSTCMKDPFSMLYSLVWILIY